MFKLVSSIVLVFSLLSTTAQASAVSGLKDAYDELQYALTVEWDQKDKVFHQDQLKNFNQKLEALQKEGLTHKEMMDFSKSLIKNEKIAKDLEESLKVISADKLSTEQAQKFLKSALEKSFSQGAHYQGDGFDVAMYIVVGFILVLVVGLGLSGGMSASGSSSDGGDYSSYDSGYSDGYTDGSSGW